MFSFQVDESTDVSSCAQLLVFVRYTHSDDIKEEFLFCSQLDTTTTSADIMGKMKTFFEAHGLQLEDVCEVCTDGAPAMLGSRSGFTKKVKELVPEAKGTHCFIHRYALASKTLSTALKNTGCSKSLGHILTMNISETIKDIKTHLVNSESL